MYKAKYGLVPSNVVEIFSIKSSKYQVRNIDFHLPRFNWYFGPYIYGLDWTAKSRTNLPYNPLSPTYGILTL